MCIICPIVIIANYQVAIKTYLDKEWENPSDDFVKYLLGEIYDGMKTKQTVDRFQPIIKKGLNQYIQEKVNDKLNAALKTSTTPDEVIIEDNDEEIIIKDGGEIVTTPEELESYTIVKIVLKDLISLDRLFYRDNKSYFNILLDDNIRKWILRVRIGSATSKIELNNEEKTVFEIDSPIDIYNYSDDIINVTKKFL